MTRWRTVQLGAALELAYGKSLPKTARTEGVQVPVYGSNGVSGWHDEALVEGPTVIVGRKGSAGAVQYVDGPCYPIDTTYYVRPRAGFDFDMKFLFYLLRRLDLSRLKTATGVPGLTREDAYRERIPVPPIDEQRRIVDVLSRAEGIVRLRREAQAKAAEIDSVLFFDMFARHPSEKYVRCADVCHFITKGTTPQSGKVTSDRSDATVPFIKVLHVTDDGDLDFSKQPSFVSEELHRGLLARSAVCPNDCCRRPKIDHFFGVMPTEN